MSIIETLDAVDQKIASVTNATVRRFPATTGALDSFAGTVTVVAGISLLAQASAPVAGAVVLGCVVYKTSQIGTEAVLNGIDAAKAIADRVRMRRNRIQDAEVIDA